MPSHRPGVERGARNVSETPRPGARCLRNRILFFGSKIFCAMGYPDSVEATHHFQVISDVHLGRSRKAFSVEPHAPTLLICGDICNIVNHKRKLKQFLKACKKDFERVIWIFGNHEHFSRKPCDFRDLVEAARRVAAKTGTTFLHNSCADVGARFRVLGTPLYTGMPLPDRLFRRVRPTDSAYIWERRGGAVTRVDAARFAALHAEAKEFLVAALKRCRRDERRAVIVSHYVPFLVAKEVDNDAEVFAQYPELHGVYNTRHDMRRVLRAMQGTAVAWAFGHSHMACQVQVFVNDHFFWIVSNPVGHAREGPDACGYTPACVIEARAPVAPRE
eukprot:gnl/Chilomastix_cuspidata/4369.p1 GENE.gnl/Chilomastix_cuspidata/4369~~gnl/Chilomastix_cuspidata/4369.p1  ORF type:complete len:332 (-),score=97.67 gnl/Chilomastix_cuspidata/4369:57-1052(-)